MIHEHEHAHTNTQICTHIHTSKYINACMHVCKYRMFDKYTDICTQKYTYMSTINKYTNIHTI